MWSFVSLRKEHRLRVFENGVLRIIFGTKWDKVLREWRRLHKEELNALYCIPNIIWVIKSRRMRWAKHVACTGDGRVHTRLWQWDLRGRAHLEDLGLDGWIILKWIFKKGVWQARTGLIRLQGRDRCQVLANAVVSVQVPKNTGNVSTSSEPSSFSARTLAHGVN